MAPVTKTAQFIFAGVTAAKLGQKLKKKTKLRYAQAKTLFAMPMAPGRRQGPQTVRDIPSLVVDEDVVSVSKASLGVRMAPVQRR
jgi:hypothetical protein